MKNRTLVMVAVLFCDSCATGEELDFSLLHSTAATGSSGQPSTTGSGNSGTPTAASGSGGSNGQSGSSTTTASTTGGGGQSGSNGQSGSGGAAQGGASPAGTGGAAGGASGGTSGTGGSIGMSDAGFVAGMQVLYAVQSPAAMSPYIQFELHAKNAGTSMVAVSELKLRYYFTNEVMKPPQFMPNWSHITTGATQPNLDVTWMVNPLTPAKTNADTYIEFSLSSSQANLAPNQSADFSWQMQGPNPATDIYNQTNDYSFDATKTTLLPWDHVVLLRNGTVVWGTPPP